MPHAPAPFPAARLRRLRRTECPARSGGREPPVSAADLIWPVFIREGEGVEEPIASMPGVARLSLDRMLAAAEGAHGLGVTTICLFPYTDQPAHRNL
jgi:porphobilinogen synthase